MIYCALNKTITKDNYLTVSHRAHSFGCFLQLRRSVHGDTGDSLQEGVNEEESRECLMGQKENKAGKLRLGQ